MAFPRILSADEAAALIPDEAIVTVSSSSGLGCPDAVLAAIGRRFDASGHPRNLTTLHPIAAGDMWGVKGVDHIAKPGLLARIMGGLRAVAATLVHCGGGCVHRTVRSPDRQRKELKASDRNRALFTVWLVRPAETAGRQSERWGTA